MRRYNNNYRRYRAPRARRPTDRVIRAASTLVSGSTTTTGYVWTCEQPCTITNFKLDTGSDTGSLAIAYAWVYVPEGYNANAITYPSLASDMYNPTKNVIISGVLNGTSTEDHKSSRYSRKCVAGDRLALLFYDSSPSGTSTVSFELSFTVVA